MQSGCLHRSMRWTTMTVGPAHAACRTLNYCDRTHPAGMSAKSRAADSGVTSMGPYAANQSTKPLTRLRKPWNTLPTFALVKGLRRSTRCNQSSTLPFSCIIRFISLACFSLSRSRSRLAYLVRLLIVTAHFGPCEVGWAREISSLRNVISLRLSVLLELS
ncbi:hypothetical protein BIW11_13052 [Tropilaelaps mercedesae]|uniref:Uncharacterized protein n=1 Tax=Tropilaelaps mercedesae TaxID=418985 RepID=A0A1V9X4M4_9ACAR|nr:hypothetical protein BIW11_13052 [Tropilaelaps mercedesae]